MSFAYDIKSEICNNRPFRHRNRKAQAYGLLLFGNSFGIDTISIHTEHKVVARLYADCIADLIGLTDSITLREVKREGRRSIYMVTVDSLTDRAAVLSYFGCKAEEDSCGLRRELLADSDIPDFLSGAFLAAASVPDPEKEYRVEFAISSKPLCDDLAALLAEYLTAPKSTTRRNDYLLYYKESENIEDLLTFIGAPKAALNLMEIKIVKELRNKVNRETNCETANITKTIDASMTQIEQIQLIQSRCGIDSLPEDLREIAVLRLENPDFSLRELGKMLSTPISRSGVNHRLKRIAEFAEPLRNERRNEQ